ncbi:hypothetical protein JK361_29670 [Streptomyces sp. 5-8]|uniref:Uncharacterized protein n=1 Tax=Streptomyces musisoli TaxID=2802280 RepID=A0ABS1P8J4_9ACTN|nr:hypothetical protein [Streptomyces musisoli]MBL1108706.1 hypothetical protein [Streptomyces musisoli]
MSEEGAGAAGRLLALIGEHRDTIRQSLDDTQYAVLLTRLTALAEAAPDDDRAVRKALQAVRQALLSLPHEHPVRRELSSSRLAVTLPPPGPATVAGAKELMAWFRLPSPPRAPAHGPGSDGHPLPGEPVHGSGSDRHPLPGEPVHGSGSDRHPLPGEPAHGPGSDRYRLLGEPALSADEARARCGGAPPPELIRLRDPRDGDRYPRFQFEPAGGTPHGVVLEVNRLLLADIDPWGAAAWWFSGNTWLGGTPASLLGRLPDHRLVGAARELAEGE